jgi:hypothetical protein
LDQVLTTDGTGNLYWANGGGGDPGGSNTQVQFNDSGTFGGTANFTFNSVTSTVTASYFRGDGSNLSNVSGGGPVTITNVSTLGTYAVNINDQVLVIRSPGPVTISLPTLIATGRRIVIKDFLGNSRVGNAITIVSPPTNTIDGSVAFAIDEPYNVVTVVGASSTEWMIL